MIMFAMLLMVVGAYAQEGKNIYNKYSGGKGVTAVYISPSMFKLIGKLPDLEVETSEGKKMNLAPLINSFEGFYMLEITDPSVFASVRKDVDAMIGKGHYELLMEVKEEGTNVNIYTVGNDKIIESFVFMAYEGDSVQFISIDGAMNRSDIENLIVGAM